MAQVKPAISNAGEILFTIMIAPPLLVVLLLLPVARGVSAALRLIRGRR